MMLLVGLLGLWALYMANCAWCLYKNVQAAKRSGLPYIVTPVYYLNGLWFVQNWFWIPLLKKVFPEKWLWPWVQMLSNDWSFDSKRKVFDYMESNVFLVASPGRVVCFVADAEAISQITTRRNDFVKPVELYKGVDIFGKSLVSTEGQVWRHHRKMTAPAFTEKSNFLVWKESLHQAQAMVDSFLAAGERISKPSLDLGAASMRLSLHVISRAGFGVRLLWPHEELAQTGQVGAPPPGHTMTFKDALSTLLDHIIQLFVLPPWLLKYFPLESTKTTYQALTEWGLYMNEMYTSKRDEVVKGTDSADGMDLMGALVRGAGVTNKDKSEQLLTTDEIMGNAFVFILAGHETTANTIHFSLLQLAMHPSSQKALQASVDSIFGSRTPDQWSFDEDMPRLASTLTGATMNETLRVLPAVTGIPKSVAQSGPQSFTLHGRRVTIPAGALVNLNTVGAHLDPANWPHTSREDLYTFRPERWVVDTPPPHVKQSEEEDPNEIAPGLYRPPRGAFVPFSDGPRACIGRRFAQVEVLAVLAVIMQKYSVELAVEEMLGEDSGWPFKKGDAELQTREMLSDETQKRQAWRAAKGKAEDLFTHGMAMVITLQMRKGRIPMRFVKRGSERFWYDD